jgi:PQQ-dependent catabolism-associated beta-propeller protein
MGLMKIMNAKTAAAFVAAILLSSTAFAGRAYVSNEDGHTITVIDTSTNAVVSTIPVGKRPRGISVSPDGSLVYVALSGLPKCPPSVPDAECEKLGRDLKADGVAVVDAKALKLVRVFNAGSDPEQFDLASDGRLYVANEDAATTTVLDVSSGKIIARVPVGKEPEGVRVSPDGRWTLVTNESDNSISVIDTKSLKEVKHIIVGKRPRDAAFTPDSRMAYVSGEFDSSVYRIRVPEGTVERIVQLDANAKPMSVKLDATRNRLYVSTGRGGKVAVIDVAGTPKLIQEIAVGQRPWGIALSEDGKLLYTANGPSNDVSVVDTATLKVIKRIPVGQSPWGIALAK